MNFIECIQKIESMNGNIQSTTGTPYITAENIEKLPLILEDCDELHDILITPYLIPMDMALYELHYYEFAIEISNISNSYYLEYSENNNLPLEITKNLKPKAVASKMDRSFFLSALEKYISSMKQMDFLYDKMCIPKLQKANLYFQIF